jgi:hypothetical protein
MYGVYVNECDAISLGLGGWHDYDEKRKKESTGREM